MNTVKSLLEAHALIEGHETVWTPKRQFFKQFSPKIDNPRILKKNGPALCRNISNLLTGPNKKYACFGFPDPT